MRLDLGNSVHCADATFGELADVVIDPSTRHVTHLVVQPHHRHDLARLIPIGHAHVDEDANAGIALDVTVAEINKLQPLQESEYLRLGERPPADPAWDVGIEDMSSAMPYSPLGANTLGAGMEPVELDSHVTFIYDRVPKGMVELRRESAVTSADGHHLGHVVALVVDDEERIAQIVLEHGHLWNKRKIPIPSASIDRIESDEVVLTLSSDVVTG
jgi:sporulation protein YlmC with PRC-barrel domain